MTITSIHSSVFFFFKGEMRLCGLVTSKKKSMLFNNKWAFFYVEKG